MADTDWNKVLKYMLLSGLAGGGIASLAGLSRLLKSQDYYGKGPSEWDDDTMYVVKNNEDLMGKQASDKDDSKSNGWTQGMAIAGIPLAFTGGFSLANWLVNKYMREQAQQELDAAQLALINNSGYKNIEKKATSGLGHLADSLSSALGLDTPLGWGAGLALLTALGSGYATHQYLAANWPVKKPKVLAKPKKIKVVESIDQVPGYQSDDEPETGEDVAGLDKQSSYDGVELAVRMLCNMDKEAAVASDVVHACAAGRAREFENAVNDIGFMAAVDLVKGASTQPVNDTAKNLAVTYCTKVASFAPQFRLAASAEYQTLHPELCKEAAMQSDNNKAFLEAFANDFGAAIRSDYAVELGVDTSLEKEASDNDFIDDAFKNVLEKLAASPVLDNSDIPSTSISSGPQVTNSFKPKSDLKDETQKYNAAQTTKQDKVEDDVIDQVMAGAEKPDIPEYRPQETGDFKPESDLQNT